MATFGSQVNPQLGAVNYAPYTQGALVGAQGMAQGIAGLGAGIGQGIAQYKEVQKQNKEKEALVKSGIKSLESLTQLPGIEPGVIKAVSPLLQIANDPNASLVQKEQAIRNGIQQFNTVIGLGQQAAAQKLREREVKVAEGEMVARQIAAMRDSFSQPVTSIPVSSISEYAKQGIDVTGKLGPSGEIINPSFSGMPATPKYVRPREEEIGILRDKLREEGAYKFNEDVISAGTSARSMERNIDQAIGLLDEAQTGFGQNVILKAKQLGKTLGMEVGDLSSQEQLRVLFGNEVMNRVAQTKGAVSDREMRMFSDYSANYGNTPDGNKQILGFAKAAYRRAQDVSKLVRDLRKDGKNEFEIQLAVEDFQDKNPLPVLAQNKPAQRGRFTIVEE